jgi:hypothetical protein
MRKSLDQRVSKIEDKIVFYDEETAHWAAGLSDTCWAKECVRFMTAAELIEWLDSSHGGDMDRFFQLGFRACDRRDRFIARYGHARNDIVAMQQRGAAS